MIDFLTRRGSTWHFVRRVPAAYAALDRRGIIRHSTRIKIAEDRVGRRASRVAETLNGELERFWKTLSGGSSADGAAGQTTTGNPAGFDIGGVKLGMTPDDAIAVLKGFDPPFTVTKKYFNYAVGSYGLDGNAIETYPGAQKDTAYLNDLVAVNAKPKMNCQGVDFSGCSNTYDKDPDTITVWFSRMPGEERVIAIQRIKSFEKDPKPAIASLMSGVTSKYPEPQPTYSFTNGAQTTGWLFNAKGQLLSRAAARAKGLAEGGGLPPSVRAGDGLGLNVFFVPSYGNAQIAQSFSVALYDGNALYRSIEQAKVAYRALKAKADAKQLDQSKAGAAPTKF